MHKKLTAIAMLLAVGVLAYAPSASALLRWSVVNAETCAGIARICLTPANANPVWGDDPGEDVIVLDRPLFVVGGGKLTILPGVTVRGNPRNGPVLAGVTAGTPGVIVVTQSGEIDAQGGPDAAGVIIMTTAAVDNNGDFQPDDLDGNGFRDPYPGYDPGLSGNPDGLLGCNCGTNGTPADVSDDCVGTDGMLGTVDDSLVVPGCVVDATPSFHDDSPRTAPLAPLTPSIVPDPGLGPDGRNGTTDDQGGDGNVQLWGGVVINGQAPTNTAGADTSGNEDFGFDIVEGLTVPGFPPEWAIYGGIQPHDSSGIFRYVSIRHTGDEIGVSNELNGITLGAVGDGTQIDHVETYTVFDDCFEWFGGTVNTSYLTCSFAGDDGFDTDQGYTGTTQFGVFIAPHFNERDCVGAACAPVACPGGVVTDPACNPDGGVFGTESGDQVAENDGEDCTLVPANCNKSGPARPGAPVGPNDRAHWPMQASMQYNLTAIGNADYNDFAGVAGTPDYDMNGDCTAASTPFLCCTGLDAGTCEAALNSGYEFRNGAAGELRNSIISHTGSADPLIVLDTSSADWSPNDIICYDYDAVPGSNGDTDNGDALRVVATTFDMSGVIGGSYPQPTVPWDAAPAASTGAWPSDGFGPPAAAPCDKTPVADGQSQALENGDTLVLTGGSVFGNLVNDANYSGPGVASSLLTDPDTTFNPTGDAAGHLVPSLKPGSVPIDLSPLGGVGSIFGILPGGHPVADPNATIRGAFEAGVEWTDGWTAMSIGGVN